MKRDTMISARSARSTSKGQPTSSPPKRNPKEPATVGSLRDAPLPKEPPTGGKSPLESTTPVRLPFSRLNTTALRLLHGNRIDCPTCGRPGWLDLSNIPFSMVSGNAVFWNSTDTRWECCDERNANRGPRVVEFDAAGKRIN